MTQKKKLPSFEEMEKALLECVQDGFLSFSLEERKKILNEQEKQTRVLEKRYRSSQAQMLRQFSL